MAGDTATAEDMLRDEAEPTFTADYLGYLLARASFLVNEGAHAHARAAGLSVMEWRVLATLWGRDRIGVGELAQIVLERQPTLTKALDRMAEKGLVRREGSETDRRVVLVSMTETGRASIGPVLARTRALERRLLDGYAPDEELRLKSMLKELIERLGGEA